MTLNLYTEAWSTSPSPGSNAVFAAANKIIKSKINATVNFHMIPSADYDTKVPTLLASHTDMDLLYAADWLAGYTTPAETGAFDSMNSLLHKYGKGILAAEPSFMLKSGEVNGNIDGIGPLQYNPLDPSWDVQSRALKASGAKYTNLGGRIILSGPNKYKESSISGILAGAKKKLTGTAKTFTMMGYPYTAGDQAAFDPMAYGLWPIASSVHTEYPFYVKMGTTTVTMGLPELKSYANLMRSWYVDGYMEKDAGTNATPPALPPSASAVDFDWSGGGVLDGAETRLPGYTSGEVDYQAPLAPRPFFMGYNGGWSIPDSSSNPSRAMMLLNLFYTDPQLVMLLSYGFDKTDYTIKNDTVYPTKNPTYTASTSCWQWGNCFITPTWSYSDGSNEAGSAFWPAVKKYLNESTVSPLSSFVFNETPVSSEWAEIGAAVSAIDQPLFTGSVPVNAEFSKYVSALKGAGAETVLQQVQHQLNSYLKANPAAKKALLSDTYGKLMSLPALKA